MLAAATSLLVASACDCAGGPGYQPLDVAIDTGAEVETDVPLDGADVPDAAPDGPIDSVGDEAPPPRAVPFQAVTSGGGRSVSEHYRLEVFIAPVPPVGSGSSEGYAADLGPGATRSP
jgi:hypothetical protein